MTGEDVYCPECGKLTAAPDNNSVVGIRRVDTAGSIRLHSQDSRYVIITCCHCGWVFDYQYRLEQ